MSATKERPVWRRPLPNIDPDIEPFWDALKEHRFLLFRCSRCGASYFPAAYCRNHENQPYMGEMGWREASGLGVVQSFNVHERAFDPSFADLVPYVYAMIDLDEGPAFGSNIINVDPYQVKVGMRVKIAFLDVVAEDGQEFTMPMFEPA